MRPVSNQAGGKYRLAFSEDREGGYGAHWDNELAPWSSKYYYLRASVFDGRNPTKWPLVSPKRPIRT